MPKENQSDGRAHDCDHEQIFCAHGHIHAHRKSRVIGVLMAMCTSKPIIGKRAPRVAPLAKSYKCLGLGPGAPEPWSLEGALGPGRAPEPLYFQRDRCPIILRCASSQVENTSGIEDSKRGVWNRDRRESIELVGGGGAHYWWLLWALCVERFSRGKDDLHIGHSSSWSGRSGEGERILTYLT